MVLDGGPDGFRQTRRFLLDIRPGVFLVVHQRHGFGLAFGEADKKDHDRIDQDGLNIYEAPTSIEEIFQLEVPVEGQMLLERGSIANIF